MMILSIDRLIDDAKCYEVVREIRWSGGVKCPHCGSLNINKRGFRERQPNRQRYLCKSCYYPFDDLSGTILAGHHQPLRIWMLCLYLMGLNLSNLQIAQELNLNKDDVQAMTTQLRTGIVKKNQPSHSTVPSSVMKSMWWLDTKATRLPSETRGVKVASDGSKATEGGGL